MRVTSTAGFQPHLVDILPKMDLAQRLFIIKINNVSHRQNSKLTRTTAMVVLTPTTVESSTLSFAILIFIAHNFANSLLLSPWNPLRCAYWNRQECTDDESWMANWFALAHFHVTTLLGCMLSKSTPEQQEKLSYLICAIMMAYLAEGVFTLDQLDWLMAALQTMFYIGTMAWIKYATYEDPNAITPPRPTLPWQLSKMNMSLSSSLDARAKLPLSTVAVGMHVVSSVMRVVDMTFGSGQTGYKGDMSR
jgi:hypothetical protein